MRKSVIKYGLIAGSIVSVLMLCSIVFYKSDHGTGSMVMGFGAMLIAFAFIFVGVKNFRDEHNGGVITFGQALKAGLLISLIASTMYVVVWAIEYKFVFPDFMEKYSASMINKLKASGASQAAIEKETANMAKMGKMYQNPLFFTLMTYAEILPIGILMSLVSAAVFKRKQPQAAARA